MSKLKTTKKFQKYLPIIILIAILLLGAFFRLYKIREYITFLGDEGRDVLVVKRLLIDRKPTLLGPITSVGAMYMGPIYYYFMVPFLWLWNFDPVGPAVMVAFFAVATIGLTFLVGAEFFHPTVGFIAALLYSISPLTIIYGRSSWNPNIVPFFSILIVYSLLNIVVKRRFRWFMILGFSLGILLQLHYVTFVFFPVIIVCLFLIRFRIPWRSYLSALLFFIVSYSPFLLFELRHKFVNSQAVWRFIFTQKEGSQVPFIFGMFHTINDVFVRLFWRLVVIENAEITKLLILIGIITLVMSWKHFKKVLKNILSIKIILIWLGVGILGFSFYQGVIYDYYFGSLFPVPFILTGLVIYSLSLHSKIGKIAAMLTLVILIFFALKKSPLAIPPSNLLKNTETISRFVYQQTYGRPYNFALIAGRNSDHAYRYFLELWKNKPVTIEPETVDPGRKTVTEQLIVVCEEKICQPLGHPLWEIAGFGRAEIKDEWQVVTARVFRLVPYKGYSCPP